MEKQLNLAVKLSLEELALRRSVINLWCETDVWSSIEDIKLESLPEGQLPSDFGKTLHDMVKEKISGIVIAEPIKKRMMNVFKLIGSDLMIWKIFHENLLHFSFKSLNILKYLRLTSAGSVDYRNTAEELVRLGALNDVARYTLSCCYCLDKYIPVLWQELSAQSKEHFLSMSFITPGRLELPAFWAWFMKKNPEMYGISKVLLSQNFSFDQHAFHVSVLNGNKAAAKHFYQKLTSEERVISLSRAVDAVLSNEGRNLPRMHSDFPKETLPDVLCYLLSLMSPKQQMQVLKERPPAILRCFAAWPWQDIFVEISKVIMTFIREEMTFLQR